MYDDRRIPFLCQEKAFFPFKIRFRKIALMLTINRPLLNTICNAFGIFTKTSDANAAPTPIAMLVPTILKLLSFEKSSLDKMEIPEEVITPNNASVAPPSTHLGTAVNTAEIFGKIPARVPSSFIGLEAASRLKNRQ